MIKIKDNWNKLLKDYNLKELQFFEEYSKLYGDSKIFFKEKNGDLIFLIILINEKYRDFETPYGYGSFYSSKKDKNFTEPFFEEVFKILKDKGLIAGLIRFNPFFPKIESGLFQIEYVRDVFYIDLFENYMDDFKSSVRNKINVAKKKNFLISEKKDEEEFLKFYEIYNDMIEKKNGRDFLKFSEKYFIGLKNIDFSYILNSYRDGKYFGGSIFLIREGFNSYYHLSSVLRNEMTKGLSNLLLYRGCELSKNLGSERMILGGGTKEGKDGLTEFKRSFTKKSKPFYIGKVLLDKKRYDELVEKYDSMSGNGEKLFLRYREILG
ncbi:MAG: hypothetical protein QME48_00535 [bacterium]|uniref:BioF2-like acetyltransferase domain-containing protein n=1 Tax=candidate division TA06 bacterium 34_109 TaxID=1635277 RepID=A0A117M6U1_UNCT6|nr:MAG: hypothetical protein XE03_0468 [candidate division TA06 bacterium 34_109]MDI6699711.1 hypothetical protein [bacterium]HCP17485.1 hypothetical protein [candidate division WOR-3 bacterium]